MDRRRAEGGRGREKEGWREGGRSGREGGREGWLDVYRMVGDKDWLKNKWIMKG